MKKCKITVMRKACYKDLMKKYENPMEHACDMEEGQVLSQTDGVSQTECAIVPGRVCPFCYDTCLWRKRYLQRLDEE